MKRLCAYITGILGIAIVTAITLSAVPSFAEHTEELHEAKYYGAPGDVLHGQVTVMNPTNETKTIRAEIIEDEANGWLYLPNSEFTVGPRSKAVIQYDVTIPKVAQEDCTHVIHVREIAPANTLSIKHTVSVFIKKPAAPGDASSEINILYTTLAIMLIVAFGLGLSLCAVCCLKRIPTWLNGKKKRKKARKRDK